MFADENIPRAIVSWLRGRGHDVLYASEAMPGAADSDWLARSEAEERVVLTSDKDFGDLIFRDHLTGWGVILLRLDEMPIAGRIARLDQAWSVVEVHPAGRFLVISAHRIRLRDLRAIEAEDPPSES